LGVTAPKPVEEDQSVVKPAPAPPETEPTPLSPEVIALLAMLAVDALLWAWERQRVRMATRMYRARREFMVALDSDGGLKALAGRSVPRWLKASPGAAGRGS
jgi:hypothetical protein